MLRTLSEKNQIKWIISNTSHINKCLKQKNLSESARDYVEEQSLRQGRKKKIVCGG